MRKRTGDWRDLLSAYALALDAKKIYVGFIATVSTVILMVVVAFLYMWLAGKGLLPGQVEALAALGDPWGDSPLLWRFLEGSGLHMVGVFLPLLNPFHGGLVHLALSALLYAGLFWVWSGAGGVVSRLTALEYARDDLPTLAEGRAVVKSKRKALFLAPLMPFVAILFLALLNILGGFIASFWYVGRILLIVPGFPLLVASTLTIIFLALFGALSFGLMMPAVTVGGKDAFESWSTAYSYVLWGLRRFICYTLVVGVIGVIGAAVAWALTELLIYCIYRTVEMGFFSGTPWVLYEPGLSGGAFRIALLPGTGGFGGLLSGIIVALMVALRAIPVAYVFSYFFTANTIIFFLMRKDQDNIEIEEVYEEADEEEEVEGFVEGPVAGEEEAPAEEEPQPEQQAEEEGPAEQEAAEKEPEEESAPEEEEAEEEQEAEEEKGE